MNPEANNLQENERLGTIAVAKIPEEGENLISSLGTDFGEIVEVTEYPARQIDYDIYQVTTADGNMQDVRVERPENQPTMLEKACQKSNEYLKNEVIPKLSALSGEIQKFGNSINKIIDEKGTITEDEVWDLAGPVIEQTHHIIDELVAGHPLKSDLLVSYLLESRIHALKDKFLFKAYLDQVSASRYNETPAPRFEYKPPVFSDIFFESKDFELNSRNVADSVRDAVYSSSRALKSRKRNKIDIIYHMDDKAKKTNVLHKDFFTVETVEELLKNAIDAMPEGGRLMVNVSTGKDTIIITIADTGEGISRENINKILRKGFTTKKTGTGLGLPIVKGYVEEILKGKFDIESTKGKGTTVTLLLPIQKSE
jgi:anti-sigma regulatory factor (Ser/Thr protein kinase)